MILKEECFKVGRIERPHGIHGELSFSFTPGILSEEEDYEYFLCELDGILVPFYIENLRLRTDRNGFVQLEDINTEDKARQYQFVSLYLPNEFWPEETQEEWTPHIFVGFKVIDSEKGELGEITSIQEYSKNLLFSIDYQGNEVLIPVDEEFIENIDPETKTINVRCPEGLIDLYLEE